MKKKTAKKLVLSRETVRRMTEGELRGAAGGTHTRGCTQSNYVDCEDPTLESKQTSCNVVTC